MSEINIWILVTKASLVVQLVMLALLAMSVITWGIIAYKNFMLNYHKRLLVEFEEEFWSNGNLQNLYDKLSNNADSADGIANVFYAGFKDYIRINKGNSTNAESNLDSLKRAMRIAVANEEASLNKHLSLLASCGSVSPYIGLFGTVWGIMSAFLGIANSGSADLASVAPGIAEALIATAMGIFVAIPAVVAYNQYTARVQNLVDNYEIFATEFMGILQRRLVN